MLFSLFTLPVFAKNTILILGDSISTAYGIEASHGWVELLKNRLVEQQYNYDVVNISISGNTTSNGLAQLPDALGRYKPQITIIELGGNDGLRGISLIVIKKNLNKLINLARDAGSKVLLLGVRLPPNYGIDYTKQFQQIYSDLADNESVEIVPLFLQNIDTDPKLMQADRIHPTENAQPILLDLVWDKLKEMLQRSPT